MTSYPALLEGHSREWLPDWRLKLRLRLKRNVCTSELVFFEDVGRWLLSRITVGHYRLKTLVLERWAAHSRTSSSSSAKRKSAKVKLWPVSCVTVSKKVGSQEVW